MSCVLFISRRCAFCAEIVETIKAMKELTVKLEVIDIKSMKPLPDFIDRVPILLIEEEKKLLHDEELFEYVKGLEKVVEPFMVNEMKGISDTYSFMEEKKELDHVFSFLENGEPLITNEANGGSSSEEDNKKIVNYDNFIAGRDQDINAILKAQNPTVLASQ